MNTFRLQAIPGELAWENPPVHWEVKPEQSLTITAGEKTDLFTSPQGDFTINNSPRALFLPAENFLFSAKVTVDFRGTFDAGVLILYDNQDFWAKLCFEFSPQQQPMVVSVVNRTLSDDCNSVPIAGNAVFLRIAKSEQTFAFHFSTDGRFWQMVRYFTLGARRNLRAGFSCQAPMGTGCTAVFAEIAYTTGKLKDLRNGE